MKKLPLIAIFAVVAVIQLLVPAREVWQNQHLIDDSDVYKFRLRPVDPIDPLRGRYVHLYFSENIYKFSEPVDWTGDIEIFVMLKKDADGFVKVDTVLDHAPEVQAGVARPFVKADLLRRGLNNRKIYISYPFKRFYMDEDKAQQAEAFLRTIADTSNVYAEVAISEDGEGLLKDVKIDGVPIHRAMY